MTEKLKSCPFCGGEAIKGKNGHGNWVGCSESECYVQTRVFWTEGEAVQAWNTRAADENSPLTLDELRQMEGEPVWCEYSMNDKKVIDCRLVKIAAFGCFGADMYYLLFRDYGKTWLAYRRKPELQE